jgi:hypothetical protein
MIDRKEMLAAVDARIEAAEKLLTSAYAKQADRRVLASTISALMKVREDLSALKEIA